MIKGVIKLPEPITAIVGTEKVLYERHYYTALQEITEP